jgi:hypothetical protein
MKRNPTATALVLKKIYDTIHMILWAILVAFVLWFTVFIVPKLPEIRAQGEMLRDRAIAADEDLYCGKLGMGAKTTRYQDCISYLRDYRVKIEQRFADENVF